MQQKEIFISDTWVREGVYKDIFDLIDFRPTLKINISDGGQTFTPFFTGNINWIASKSPHYWYLTIRFPKSSALYNWKELVYTNEIPRVSKYLENLVRNNAKIFFINGEWDGSLMYDYLKKQLAILSKPVDKPLELPNSNCRITRDIILMETNHGWAFINAMNYFPFHF